MSNYECPKCHNKLILFYSNYSMNTYKDIHFKCDCCGWKTEYIELETNLGYASDMLKTKYNFNYYNDYNIEHFKPLSVKLVNADPELFIDMIIAARISHNSVELSDTKLDEYELIFGEKDKKLLQHIIKNGHTSVLEHIFLQYEIEMPRFLLQEFARHRMGVSLTVKSTRYTLKEIFDSSVNLSKFLYKTNNNTVNKIALDTLRSIVREFKEPFKNNKVSIDSIKRCIPETYMTKLFVTLNGRGYRHMFELRATKFAHPDFRKLMKMIYDKTPQLYNDVLLYGLNLYFDSEGV